MQITAIDNKNKLYPVFLKLDRLSILLVGGGNVAAEKLRSLLSNDAQAHITIVAPLINESVAALAAAHRNCIIIQKPFEAADLEDKDLVLGATNDKDLHLQLKTLANLRGLLVNIADTPALCDFYLGSIVQKGHLKLAISTNGQSPTAAKRIKEVLNESLPDELDGVITNLNQLRKQMNGNFGDKVKKLDEITKVLVEKDKSKEVNWKRVASYSVIAFALMLIGHFIFSYIPLKTIGSEAVRLYGMLDKNFPYLVLAGFLAQLVDGALGMGYGVTCSAILQSTGVPIAAVSGSIHTAEMFASGASGYSHYKFGNVNKKLFKALIIPGVLGAIAGALLLVFLGDKYSAYIRPFIALYTLILGGKFILNAFRQSKIVKKFSRFRLLAATGGFFDSFGGGGWGPIVTSTLINGGRNHKYVIGTVSLTEFFVTLASAFTFFTLLRVSHWQIIIALIIGGFIAAPIAAKLAGKLPKKTAFILLGTLIIIWSGKVLYDIFI